MKLTFLPRSLRILNRGSRLVLAALALLVAASMIGVFASASVALASSRARAADDLGNTVSNNVAGTQVVQTSVGSATDRKGNFPQPALAQQWQLTPDSGSFNQSDLTKSTFTIGNGVSDPNIGRVCLNAVASPGTPVTVEGCNGTANQQWVFRLAPDGYYDIVNSSSGLCLNVQYASLAAGAPVILWPCNSGGNQASSEWTTDGIASNPSPNVMSIININSGLYLTTIEENSPLHW